MTCQSIMSSPPATLVANTPVTTAAATLVAHPHATLPVVDKQGRFVGVFGAKELIGLMLPRAVRLGDDLADLGFIADGHDDLRARLRAVGKDPVSKHMAPHQTVRPETALAEALLMLHRGDAFLPVVDASGHLVGVVTAAAVLAHIAGGL